MILGAQWLACFDDVLMNFKKLYLKFYDGNELCELHGKPYPTIKVTSPSKMVKLLNKSSSIVAIHLCSISLMTEAATAPIQQVAEDNAKRLITLLNDYANVFAEPQSLLPQRHLDHLIDLK